MKKKNIILISVVIAVIVAVVAIILAIVALTKDNDKNKSNDAEKFSKEYTEVSKNNVFVYRSATEIINILKNGSGIVYLGFPECPWCQRYTKYLNEVATELGVEKIYYYNIREDRQNNTEDYKQMVELLKEHLQYDEEGNSRIYAPSVIALKKGEIVGFDDETAWDTKGFKTPAEYWNDDEVKDLKDKLEKMVADTNINMCTECK